MNVSYNNLFLIKMLYLIKRARPFCLTPNGTSCTKKAKQTDSQIQRDGPCYCQWTALVIAVSVSGF